MKFHATAEHCHGKSVGHPCSKGVYEDATELLDLDIEATSYEEAERLAQAALAKLVREAQPCDCRRKEQPGSDAWWDSVAISLEPLDDAARAAYAAEVGE